MCAGDLRNILLAYAASNGWQKRLGDVLIVQTNKNKVAEIFHQ